MAETSIRSQIQGLINVREQRGLVGDAAIAQWTTMALTMLLKIELSRLDRDERIATNLGGKS